MECDALVIATGGSPSPKLGATDFGYRLAEQFGLRLTTTRPGLVPVTLPEENGFAELSGVSLPVVRAGRRRGLRRSDAHHSSRLERAGHFAGLLLLARRRTRSSSISCRNEPGDEWLLAQRSSRCDRAGTARAALAGAFCRRLVQLVTLRRNRSRNCARTELEALARLVHRWPIRPNDTEGYPEGRGHGRRRGHE